LPPRPNHRPAASRQLIRTHSLIRPQPSVRIWVSPIWSAFRKAGSMFRRLVIAVLTTALATLPIGSLVTPEGSVARADSGYCDYAVSANAFLYENGAQVGSSGTSGIFLDAETPDHCAAVGQNYALANAGAACGGYDPGIA